MNYAQSTLPVSQSVEVDLLAHVPVGRRCDARHDVVVIPAAEVLALHGGAVVHGGIEDLGHLAIEHPGIMPHREPREDWLQRLHVAWTSRSTAHTTQQKCRIVVNIFTAVHSSRKILPHEFSNILLQCVPALLELPTYKQQA